MSSTNKNDSSGFGCGCFLLIVLGFIIFPGLFEFLIGLLLVVVTIIFVTNFFSSSEEQHSKANTSSNLNSKDIQVGAQKTHFSHTENKTTTSYSTPDYYKESDSVPIWKTSKKRAEKIGRKESTPVRMTSIQTVNKKNNNSISTQDNLEIVYSQIFQKINSDIDNVTYNQSISEILNTKRSRAASHIEYLDGMYQNIAFLIAVYDRLYILLEKYRKNSFPTSISQYVQDYKNEENYIRSNIESLTNNQQQLYESKYPEYSLLIDAIRFDYSYWLTLKDQLNLFIVSLIDDIDTQKVFMSASFYSNKNVIEKYIIFHANLLLDNFSYGVIPSENDEIFIKTNSRKKEEQSDRNTKFNVAGVTYREDSVREALNYLKVTTPGFSYYKGLKDYEIKNRAVSIFKYENLITSDFKLIPEPENQYDPNAIKVIIGNNYHVGYIPKEINQEILNFILIEGQYYDGVLKVIGGPLKRYDFNKAEIILDTSYNVGFEISMNLPDNRFSEKEFLILNNDSNFRTNGTDYDKEYDNPYYQEGIAEHELENRMIAAEEMAWDPSRDLPTDEEIDDYYRSMYDDYY